jgi:hypothetical protein
LTAATSRSIHQIASGDGLPKVFGEIVENDHPFAGLAHLPHHVAAE